MARLKDSIVEPMSQKLDKFLGAAYKARFLDQEGIDRVRDQLVAEVELDPELMKEVRLAETRYSSINTLGGQTRCIISKAHSDFLRSVGLAVAEKKDE
jgi:hypothetical protein